MGIDIQKITEQVSHIAGTIDMLKWAIGSFIAVSSSLFLGAIVFFAKWFGKINAESTKRNDELFRIFGGDFEKVNDNIEKAKHEMNELKSDIYSKVNSAREVLAVHDRDIENLEKKIDHREQICENTHIRK